MTPAKLVAAVARAVRDEVRPRLGRDREVVGTAPSGDVSFKLDQVAEKAIENFVAHSPVPLAVYTEDRGLLGSRHAEHLLIIDPIDGTRPAKAGLECCCVSVALAPNRPDATLGEVSHAAIYELKYDRVFVGVKGQGVSVQEHGRAVRPQPSTKAALSGLASSVEITGRPVVPSMLVLEELIDGNSLRGGAYAFASSTFAITRIVLGQLDLHLDVAARIRRDVPATDSHSRRAGEGRAIALFAYDVAAALLIGREAGLTITDAYGQTLDGVPVADVSAQWHLSCVAAANANLHGATMAAIERGMQRLRRKWPEIGYE